MRRPGGWTRGGRCHRCELAWAWPPMAAAPVKGAHCPECGARLARTALELISSIPVSEAWPWYVGAVGWPKGLRSRYRCPDTRPRNGCPPVGCIGFWYTLAPDHDGGRIVRQWAPLDVDAPEWLRPVAS